MKKLICCLTVPALAVGLSGCETEDKSEKDYRLVGETVSFDDDGYPDDYDTICPDIPEDISEDDYYAPMGVYIGEDYKKQSLCGSVFCILQGKRRKINPKGGVR